MKGVIFKPATGSSTHMKAIFEAIGNAQTNYNWLITNIDAYPYEKKYIEMFRMNCSDGTKNHVWLTGDELTAIIDEDNFQWCFAVLSGFPENVTEEQALGCDSLPYADGYEGFWSNPISIQHPMAEIEIAPWDCLFTLIISRNDNIAADAMAASSLSEDLENYNNNPRPLHITNN